MTVSRPANGAEINPLLSSHQSSDGLQILLHPLVLLTISDFITRHSLRQQTGPIVGALLGQQRGREVSLEQAFDCKLVANEEGYFVIDSSWFETRLQQFKDVLKVPPLELMGWFTVAPRSGPQRAHVSIQQQLLQSYNESAIFLAFHPDVTAQGPDSGGRLPLTIYESVHEAESSGHGAKVGEGEADGSQMQLRFRELPYSIDTGEAEMIGVDFVARGGGNAGAVGGAKSANNSGKQDRGKEKASAQSGKVDDGPALLSTEDEELVASLNARVNAIKNLHSRVRLLKTYLNNLPPSYLTTAMPSDETATSTTTTTTNSNSNSSTTTEINHPILRSIQALVNRLPLLIPTDKATFEQELLAERNDVSLVALLGSLNKSVKEREFARFPVL
ncbi:MAG: hypothetical protein M1838_004286 [Thelocarpon superellum]|nr:MAG: hypothetical protein M1838_004286 [Thelocarpon superellum]